MSLLTRDYDYSLPRELIARHPLPRREDARMMVLYREGERIEHRTFAEFPTFLAVGDLVILNDTCVIPARIFSEDRAVEFLFLESLRVNSWKCLVKPGRKMRAGATVNVHGARGIVREVCPDGARIVDFDRFVDLDKWGELPLPPYLERDIEPADQERYQTVFARERGAVAAPTAGLHFTAEMLAQIPHAFLTLHIGVGTFRPIQTALLTEHPMHAERFRISRDTADAINRARRLFAVGTTTARVLESCGRPLGAREGTTDIFIHPPHRFQTVDALLTNFHLPQSTLLMLVCAFCGRTFALRAYEEAVRERYRFYSYGDCMLIL